jgi:AcrR family transcriptional regulator
MHNQSPPDRPATSLRAEQVAQTRAALVAAGRHLFGQGGFAATSVDDLARQARVTTGALYHHFPTKTALFESVFEDIHTEVLTAAAGAAEGAANDLEALAQGFDAFLDTMLRPDVQRIIVTDGPSVLGIARFTELDERFAVEAITTELRYGQENGTLDVDDPETIARLLLGALTRGAMLIASSAGPAKTRNDVAKALRTLVLGLSSKP